MVEDGGLAGGYGPLGFLQGRRSMHSHPLQAKHKVRAVTPRGR